MQEKINKKEIERIVKYIFSAGSSFLLDLLLFSLFCIIFTPNTIGIFLSTALARVISSIYNYLINSRIVFKNTNKKSSTMYFVLVVIQLIVSATLVDIINKFLKVYVTFIKFIVDIIIFIVNYIIQKEIIFK